MKNPQLEFRAGELTAASFNETLASHNCLLIRKQGPAWMIQETLRRALKVFEFRQRQFEQRQLPPGYHKNYDYGLMTYIGIRELDLPHESPFQIVSAFAKSSLRPLFEACLGKPLYFNLTESAVRRQLPDRPELYIPFHQDGPFCQNPAWPQLNCWAPLVSCGSQAPGLEMLPVGLQEMLPVTPDQHEHYGHYALSDKEVFRHGRPEQLWHPGLEPGDVLLLNSYALHRTYAQPSMQTPRYSLELRFTGGDIPDTLRRDFCLLPLG
ncbi:MAG: hypothetical protein ACAI44_30960 [Candidatus Sericytochromatia bacterium]